MKRFIFLTFIGSLVAAALVVATNVVGEWLLAPWKYENGSVVPASVGFAFVYLSAILGLPARLLTFGSSSLFVSIAAAVVGFGLWGAAFAAIFLCLTRRSSGTRLRRAP